MTKTTAIMSAACVAFMAANADVNTFETDKGSWTDATSTITTGTYTFGGNKPIDNDATANPHAKYLTISGTASATVATANANVIDMMVQMSRCDEDYTAADFTDNPKFAVYCGTDGKLNVYCKEASNGTAKIKKLGTAYDADSWHRLTAGIGNGDALSLAVDGSLVGKYYLANTGTAVSSIEIVGTTAIDDFVAKNDAALPNRGLDVYASVDSTGAASVNEVTVGNTTVAVPKNYAAEANEDVAKKYVAGLAANENIDDFKIVDATATADGVTLTFPGSWDPSSYTVMAGTDLDSLQVQTVTSTAKDAEQNNVVTFAYPEGTAPYYYKITRN